MEQLNTAGTRQAISLPILPSQGRQADPESMFWCAAIGSGATLAFELIPRIDLLAQCSAQLPSCTHLTHPIVGQCLSIVRTLAAAWGLHSRPALLAALGGLAHFGASAGQSLVVEALAAHCADHGRAAQSVLDALQRRLAAPLAAFEALGAELNGYLAHMARASRELDADTRLVTQRLQDDQVHLFLLSQQAGTLQCKLVEAALRRQGGCRPGPDDQARRLENTAHSCAQEGVQRQLDELSAEQAATGAQATYLQSLLPTLAPYLAAVERMASAIADMAAGAQNLAARLSALRQLLARDAAAFGHAQRQLTAAALRWQALAAGLARVPPALA